MTPRPLETRMSRRPLWSPIAAVVLTLLALPSCRDEVDYGYFAVKVNVDPSATAEYLASIASCGVNVDGADIDFASLACVEGSVTGYDLGVFEWSTSTESGTVQFTVTFLNGIGRLLGRGKSAEVAISPGRTVQSTVLVIPDPSALMPPP